MEFVLNAYLRTEVGGKRKTTIRAYRGTIPWERTHLPFERAEIQSTHALMHASGAEEFCAPRKATLSIGPAW